jgi:DNA-binding response OmpR family regulator
MDNRPHIVVVEDEVTQRKLLVDYLARQKFRVTGVDGGITLRKLVERELPALVLLDVGLPGEDGFALARWLREKSGRIGIVMVTAASDTVDRVVGLETGADDYIAKPFEPRELLARVKSVLRRATGAAVTAGPRVRMGRRVLDLEKRVLIDPANSSEETLMASEFDLLKVFAENPNRPLHRDWLLEVTAHREMEAFDRAIDLRSRVCAVRSNSIRHTQTLSAQCVVWAICSCHRPNTNRTTSERGSHPVEKAASRLRNSRLLNGRLRNAHSSVGSVSRVTLGARFFRKQARGWDACSAPFGARDLGREAACHS